MNTFLVTLSKYAAELFFVSSLEIQGARYADPSSFTNTQFITMLGISFVCLLVVAIQHQEHS